MLDTAIVNHTDVDDDIDTDLPENPAPMMNSQTNHEQSWFKSSARPMLDPDKVDNTDVNADVNTDPPENSAPMMNLDLRLWQSDAQLCPPVADTMDRRPMEGISGRLLVNSPGLALAPDSGYVKDPPHLSPLVQGALGVNRRSDNFDSFDEPQFGSDRRQSSLELEDAIRREVLKSRSMGRVSARDGNGLLLSPENAWLGDKDMSLDEVSSEGLRRCNMDMDVEYQYETFNGLPVYYGGDMYDSEDTEEYDPLESCLNEEDCSISNVGSSVDNSLCMSEQDSVSNMDVASIGDFDSEDSVEVIDIFWRTVFRWMARMSSWPTFIDEDCSQLFRGLGRMCARCTCGTDGCPHGEPGRCPPEVFAALTDVAGRWRTGTDDSYEFPPDECYPG